MTPRITVVCGPPCAGKTTHVAENARPGVDVVVDMDAVAIALGSTRGHDHAGQYRWLANNSLRSIIKMALVSEVIERLWIIQTAVPKPDHYPTAEIVVLSTPADICHERATAAQREPSVHTAIDVWWKIRAGNKTASREW